MLILRFDRIWHAACILISFFWAFFAVLEVWYLGDRMFGFLLLLTPLFSGMMFITGLIIGIWRKSIWHVVSASLGAVLICAPAIFFLPDQSSRLALFS